LVLYIFSIIGLIKSSNFALVIFIVKCLGPLLSALIKGKLISVSNVEESSILAFSADSLSLCNATLSCLNQFDFLF